MLKNRFSLLDIDDQHTVLHIKEPKVDIKVKMENKKILKKNEDNVITLEDTPDEKIVRKIYKQSLNPDGFKIVKNS